LISNTAGRGLLIKGNPSMGGRGQKTAAQLVDPRHKNLPKSKIRIQGISVLFPFTRHYYSSTNHRNQSTSAPIDRVEYYQKEASINK